MRRAVFVDPVSVAGEAPVGVPAWRTFRFPIPCCSPWGDQPPRVALIALGPCGSASRGLGRSSGGRSRSPPISEIRCRSGGVPGGGCGRAACELVADLTAECALLPNRTWLGSAGCGPAERQWRISPAGKQPSLPTSRHKIQLRSDLLWHTRYNSGLLTVHVHRLAVPGPPRRRDHLRRPDRAT